MTSTGSGSATATGTSPTHAIFQPMKPIMDGLLQIKSDTFVAWMGGIPNSDWTTLKISTDKPQQSSQIHPMLDNSGFGDWSKGLDVNFTKEGGDLFSFQHKLLWHFQDMGMETITYLKDLEDPTKMVNLLIVHSGLCQDSCQRAFMTPTII